VISSFYNYAGAAGLASVIGWISVVVLAILYAVGVRKAIVCRAALVVAILSLVLAHRASETIGEIQAAPEPVVEDPERVKTLENMSKRAANVRFAEDSTTDRLDIGAASTHELAVAGVNTKAPEPYDFRSQGKQKRDAGMSKSAQTQPDEVVPVVQARVLPEAEVLRANRLDDFNLGTSRVVLYLAIALLLLDYLRRFNQTFAKALPLPLAGPLLDAVFPKAYSIYVTSKAGDTGGAVIKRYLEKSLLKRETFIYMGPKDPWAGTTNLPRLLVGKTKNRIDKLVIDESVSADFRTYTFESVWHGRGCAVAVGEEAAQRMLALTANFLTDPALNVEPARRTVNIVWEFDAPPSDETLERLAKACPTSNFRLFVVAPTPPAAASGKHFSEVYSARQIAI
jgi:hypothetical protein